MSTSQEKDSSKSDIFVCMRFKEERERKRIGQQQVAEGLGVTSKTVGRWEKEIPIPSDKLGLLQEFGFDVVYILTGERTLSQMIHADIVGAQYGLRRAGYLLEHPHQVAEPGRATPYIQPEPAERLVALVDGFKLLDESGRLAIEAMLNALLTKNKGE